MISDEDFIARFESQRWPLEDWNHREHVRLAYLYLRRCSFEDAALRMRVGIKAHNAAHGVADSQTSGYHETLTIAWLRLIDAMLREYGPEESADAFCDAHPELLQKQVLRLFYSRERLMSLQAKKQFVEPDLAPLPTPRPSR